MKLIKTYLNLSRTVKVYWNSEWSEFVVRLFKDGVENVNASYHTTDRDDALSTAQKMVMG